MKELALLVGLNQTNMEYDINYYLEELKNLAYACDMDVYDCIYQSLEFPTAACYVGKGKVEEIKMIVEAKDITIVIFDDELSPAQIKNLEKKLECKVIDRSMLILDIFAKRAKTKQAMLEVEVAQLKYLLPRLKGMSESLSRQGGGSFNAKGPGEKKLELDRRKITKQIEALEKEIKGIMNKKIVEQKRRANSSIPIVALVGYTNAGKSSTMNTLLKKYEVSGEKSVFERDMLFATLETSSRYIKLDNNQDFILMDTVGFVSKLPHHLVNSFYQTLESLKEAHVLIHVVDISSPYFEKQIKVTNDVLNHLKIMPKKTLYLLNKCDKLVEHVYFKEPNSLFYSNKTLYHFDELIIYIKEYIKTEIVTCEVDIPYTSGEISHFIEEKAQIITKIYLNDSTYFKLEIEKRYLSVIEKYINPKKLS